MKKLKVPEIYRREYDARQVRLIQNRLRVSCVVLAVLFSSAVFFGWLLYPEAQDPMRHWMTFFLTTSSLAIWVASRKVKRLFWAKLLCYLFVAVTLIVITWGPITSPMLYDDLHYVLFLFFFVMLLPWGLWDVVVLWVLHCNAWTFYYVSRDFSHFSLPPTFFGNNPYATGMVYLFFAAIISIVTRYKENTRSIRAFVLLKDVETKKTKWTRNWILLPVFTIR